AMVYSAFGLKDQKAESSYNQALEIQRALIRDFPNISQYQNDLGRTLFNLGDLYARSESWSRAEVPYREAACLWQTLVGKHPAVIDYNTKLAEACTALANL